LTKTSLFDPAMYRICILGSLDEQWSDYCGGMTILAHRLADQSTLIGVLNALHDIGCPILSVECVEAD
jgi:hypothetical protein